MAIEIRWGIDETENTQNIRPEGRMSALDGIRIRVEASTGLHDRPLHYQGSMPWYSHYVYNDFYRFGISSWNTDK